MKIQGRRLYGIDLVWEEHCESDEIRGEMFMLLIMLIGRERYERA